MPQRRIKRSLEIVSPHIATQWHPIKNGDLSPAQVSFGSAKKIWWRDQFGHEWLASINNRVKGSGCPFCSGKLPIKGQTDLATVNPSLAAEWHPTKNLPLMPDNINQQSNKKVWWICQRGHEWQATVSNRSQGNGCPYCSGKKVKAGYNDLQTTHPNLSAEWNSLKNGLLTPDKITAGSEKKVWWLDQFGHEWLSSVYNRVAGHGCPYCSGRMPIRGQNDFVTMNPSLASEWHPTKNLPVKPYEVKQYSNKKVWWICSKGHEWQESVNNRSHGNGCPYCADKKVMAGYNDLQTTHPCLAAEWHPTKNGFLTPDKVTAGADIRIWWLGKCGHEWQSLLYTRKAGCGCPVCRGLSVIKGSNDLASKRPDLAKEWHPSKNIDLTPDAITTMSEKRIWWKCAYGHEWIASVSTRSQGHGCPICAKRFHTSFPEQTIYFYLKKVFPDAINGYRDVFSGVMELDIFLPSISTGIEYDGIAWHKQSKKETSDKLKYSICQKRKIHLIRICESEYEMHNKICDEIIHIHSNPSYTELDTMLHELFIKLKIWEPDIHSERDSRDIYRSYMHVIEINSFAKKQPKLSKQWHPIKNGELAPEMFPEKSNTRVWWMCEKGHEWQATLNDRASGYGCPYCSNQKILPGYNDLSTTNPLLAKEWHPTKNGSLTPQMIPAGTEKKIWWLCEKGHEWQAIVYSRNKGASCPICARNRRKK